jgi:lipid-binding SYLF domain-containing protein
MNRWHQSTFVVLGLAAVMAGVARADSYEDTIQTFKRAGQSGTFFSRAYGYAVFPTVGGGGFIVGAAHGKGRVYVQGLLTGDSTMNLLSAGLQAGAKAYSELIFFEDKRALDDFESGHFAFGADASAVAITTAAEAGAGTNGVSSEASGDSSNASTAGGYHNGVAVFTVAKGGLMYAATLSGQHFTYTPRGRGEGD